MWIVMVGDFIVLNVILVAFAFWHWRMVSWENNKIDIFILVCNIALILSIQRFSAIIHLRLVSSADILQRLVGMTVLSAVLSYLLLKIFAYETPVGWLLLEIGTVFFIVLLFKRLLERWIVKLYRRAGMNSRLVTLVGSDPELVGVFRKLKNDPTLGYRIRGYYGDEELQHLIDELDEQENIPDCEPVRLKRLGALNDLAKAIEEGETLGLGEELYLCISRKERNLIRCISKYCDHHVVRFYYVPVSVETIGLNLKREYLDDMEIYTTYENPLQNSITLWTRWW